MATYITFSFSYIHIITVQATSEKLHAYINDLKMYIRFCVTHVCMYAVDANLKIESYVAMWPTSCMYVYMHSFEPT